MQIIKKYLLEKAALLQLTVGLTTGLLLGSSFTYLLLNKPDILPNFLSSLGTLFVAMIFGYWAYFHTREKFRLELFEKRWKIYDALIQFCSNVAQYGERAVQPSKENLAEFKETMNAAQNSFQGKGWHEAKALFGEDVIELLSKLNDAWAHISTWSYDMTQGNENAAQIIKEKYTHIRFIVSLANELPDKLKSYMYFGDYKNDR
jgi:hypothetical protein